jgi:hypothetical protein
MSAILTNWQFFLTNPENGYAKPLAATFAMHKGTERVETPPVP